MKYIVIGETNTDGYAEEFETKEEATSHADNLWGRMCQKDKNNYSAFYVLESINPDEDADDHFDGDIVKSYK